MHTVWGLLMVAAGLFMFLCGSTQSDNSLYRILVQRSATLWGNRVHRFYQMAGIAVIIAGVLAMFDVVGR